MIDPITVFISLYILNSSLPSARLSVLEVIEAREQTIINNTIVNSVTVRDLDGISKSN